MSPEARLDRLERIAKLFVKAGRRYRRNLRALDEKINIIVDSQIKSGEQLAHTEAKLSALSERTDLRFADLADSLANTDLKCAQLAESQANTDRRLNSLMDIIQRGQNGDRSHN